MSINTNICSNLQKKEPFKITLCSTKIKYSSKMNRKSDVIKNNCVLHKNKIFYFHISEIYSFLKK